MRTRCRKIALGFLLLLPLAFTRPAAASHETIAIDGDLTDLIAAVDNNLGGSNGGLKAANPLGNIYSMSCAFVNGFDLRNTYALFDFKNSMGDFTPNDMTLYLGWEVEGIIGDVDGDGNSDTYTAAANFTCANNGDQTGIGPFEAYKVFIDTDCDFVPDVTICVMNGQVTQDGVGVIPGASFAKVGKFLEVEVPNFQDLLAPTADICNASLIMTSNSQFDGLGEDTSPRLTLSVPPLIAVDKSPAEQSVCVGSDVSWVITITNPGLCTLNEVTVLDTLETGMNFVSSDPPSTGDASVRSWSFMDLAPGDQIVIDLTANVVGPCGDGLENRVTAEGIAETPCVPEPVSAFASDVATVTCEVPDVEIDKSLSTHMINSDGTVTVTLLITNTGETVLDPVEVCDQLDPKTTIDLMQTPGGTCGVGFTLGNGLGNHVCFEPFDLGVGESCTITYVVGCGEQGTHVDTAEVVAYCDGTDTNPVTDEDNDSFVCQNNEGFACPHTIGFWRQQCAQRDNGATKVCLAGMENLWRCVITETDVIQWKKNDGSFETTASLAALSDANLFTALCSQLQGPRPMTILDMAEIQYLGLMLNVCSGALPLDIVYASGPDGDITVGAAIDSIENAINTGVNVGYWKTIADNINNRLDLLADDCPEGDDLFRNIPPCGDDAAPELLPTRDQSNVLETRAYPNPIVGKSTSIFYRIPSGSGPSPVTITVFDLSGRAVRNLVSGVQNPGDYTADWNLQDDGGTAVTAGIYFYRISVGGDTVTQKIMVLAK